MTELYEEAFRPQLHFTAKENWLNDPNGLVFYRGEYHLFFQHNPFGIEWGNMTWGHAVSSDMLHWKQLDNVLLPDDMGTMFSGSAVVDENNTAGFGAGALILIYTAAGDTSEASKGQPYTQCLAYSNDGRSFTKYAGNPVLANIAGGNRDPKIVWHDKTNRWIMTLYLIDNDFAFFSSPDLKNWSHLQTITVADCAECPDFFPMVVDGNPDMIKWVWTAANARYLVGDFDGQNFIPDEPVSLALAYDHYYAVQTFSNLPDGRRIQMAWLNGLEYPDMPFNQQMGIPVELSLRSTADGYRLFIAPITELDNLREVCLSWDKEELKPDEISIRQFREEDAGGFDINIAISVCDAKQININIIGLVVIWDSDTQMLNEKMPLKVIDGKLRLRAIVDRASAEIFAGNGESLMVIKSLPFFEYPALNFTVVGGSMVIESSDVFVLTSIWD